MRWPPVRALRRRLHTDGKQRTSSTGSSTSRPSWGGMGTVLFLGPPGLPAIACAAKTFRDELLRDQAAIASFWGEAQSWIKLGKHENIVQASHVFEVRGKPQWREAVL